MGWHSIVVHLFNFQDFLYLVQSIHFSPWYFCFLHKIFLFFQFSFYNLQWCVEERDFQIPISQLYMHLELLLNLRVNDHFWPWALYTLVVFIQKLLFLFLILSFLFHLEFLCIHLLDLRPFWMILLVFIFSSQYHFYFFQQFFLHFWFFDEFIIYFSLHLSFLYFSH